MFFNRQIFPTRVVAAYSHKIQEAR